VRDEELAIGGNFLGNFFVSINLNFK
jgi:hypothetical protein